MPPEQDYDDLLVQIVEYVNKKDISGDKNAFCLAKCSFLDALGCASESLATNKDVQRLIGPYVPGTIVPNGFRLPGTSLILDPVKGAFDFSVLIRYLDHNDGFTGLEWGHPSDTLGAICSVADYVSQSQKRPITIDNILTALIKSYEIQGRLQLANSLNQRGLDHVFFEQLACCAVISGPEFFNLTRDQALAALSFCILDNAPLRAYRHAPNAIPRKGWAAASATSRAVQLVLLAATDQPGAPKVLSTPRWGFEDAVMGPSRGAEGAIPEGQSKKLEMGGPHPPSLGTYVIKNVFYKLMPCEGHSLTAVEACVRIRKDLVEKKVAWDVNQVARVNIRTHNGAVLIISKPASFRLTNPADRDHCLEFMLAVALLKGEPPEYGDYSDNSSWSTDERVDFLRERMVVTEYDKFSRDYHNPEIRSMASAVSIEFLDGTRTAELIIEHPIGSPKHQGTPKAVKEKLAKNLRLIYDEKTVNKVINMVESDEQTLASDLFDLLWKGKSEHLARF
ncbi:MmgE/PrpD family-domain-containing protein [Penicillium taxi]|uniref:MmgE/PrpD family-domain-containing protein n=1 Tax=Penicillium taxi TaxID=168475 RepID=UPI0025459CC9|nr:MmgE/PrpD family-domain-containing protein [Penicillium taxi]KAJ5899973.1 MmgE/PrpD family-domain-containing protein [Penicillium taxi]